jgi:hypothetical protein
MPNPSKIADPRFWTRWYNAGAIGGSVNNKPALSDSLKAPVVKQPADFFNQVNDVYAF